MPKPLKECIERVATGADLTNNLIQISTWIFGLFSSIALVSQNQPVIFPGINIALDSKYQFALLLSAWLSYLQFLRYRWIRLYSLTEGAIRDVNSSFRVFIFHEIPCLKHPLLLIPIVFLGIVSYEICWPDKNLREIFQLAIFIILVASTLTTIWVWTENQSESTKEMTPQEKERWIQRIRRKLNQKGYVETQDFFTEVGGDPYTFDVDINDAIEMYFDEFEIEEGLTLMPRWIHRNPFWVKPSFRQFCRLSRSNKETID